MIVTRHEKENAFLVGIEFTKNNPGLLNADESLEELALLSQTAGLSVVGEEKQRLENPNPSTFIGSGKVDEIKILLENTNADLVIFDEELTPRHFRELEKIFGQNIRVLDRTTLILDILAQPQQITYSNN